MSDAAFSIEEIPLTKRKKLRTDLYQQMQAPLPVLPPPVWLGARIPIDCQTKILGLITEGSTRVKQATLENMQRNKEEKRQWNQDDRTRSKNRDAQIRFERKNFGQTSITRLS